MEQGQNSHSVEREREWSIRELIHKYTMLMKKRQSGGLESLLHGYPKKILSGALVVVVLMGLFPPWISVYKNSRFYSKQPLGYSFIFAPPSAPEASRAYGVSVDYPRLSLQWILVLLLGGLGILFTKKNEDFQSMENLIQIEIDRLTLEKEKLKAEIAKMESDTKIARAKAVAELRAKVLKNTTGGGNQSE
jgi:hypothetical protein